MILCAVITAIFENITINKNHAIFKRRTRNYDIIIRKQIFYYNSYLIDGNTLLVNVKGKNALWIFSYIGIRQIVCLPFCTLLYFLRPNLTAPQHPKLGPICVHPSILCVRISGICTSQDCIAHIAQVFDICNVGQYGRSWLKILVSLLRWYNMTNLTPLKSRYLKHWYY